MDSRGAAGVPDGDTVTAPPTVSVLLTTYNREEYVASSIESVLAQRFQDFELIITDNQSTDRTAQIARDYERSDSRIRVIVNERNLGQFANRNLAAGLARGRFLKYHDSDDLMYPHCLETMVAALEAAPTAAFALSASAAWPGGPVPMLLSPRQCYQREYLGWGLFMGGPSCALVRREAFASLGGFVDHGVHSDHLFWLEACARYSVVLVSADLFWYRVHAGQEFQSGQAAREYAEMPAHVWRMLHSPACPLNGDEIQQARRNQAWTVAKQTWRDLRGGRIGLAVYRLRRSGLTPVDWLKYLRKPAHSAFAGIPSS